MFKSNPQSLANPQWPSCEGDGVQILRFSLDSYSRTSQFFFLKTEETQTFMNISLAEISCRKTEISQMSYEREKSVWSMTMSAKGVRCYSSSSNAFLYRLQFMTSSDFWHHSSAIDHTFYGFTGVITHAGCWKNTRKVRVIYKHFECSPNIPSGLSRR